MIKAKLKKTYRILCLIMVVVVCVILTGASNGYGGLGDNLDESLSENESIEGANNQNINLEELISDNSILRISYDLEDENKVNLGILNGYIGEEELLGNKLNEQITLEVTDVNSKQWFPQLIFDAYDWFDEEKGIGIISLVLSEDSKLYFAQLQSTTLYEELPDYVIQSFKNRDSCAIQNVQLFTEYKFQAPLNALKTMVEFTEQIEVSRNISVIMPEAL